MPHPQIITAQQLNDYADTRASEHVIPQLISQLVRQADPTLCQIPHGTEVNQSGWDGKVQLSQSSDSYIPAGASYWEITTSREPKKEATKYIRSRRNTLLDEERRNATFVFVTPRTASSGGWSEPDQAVWLRDARNNNDWNDVRILDGTQLADWLQAHPALGRWFANEIGEPLGPGSIVTALEYWEKEIPCLKEQSLHLPPQLFLENRDAACAALEALFRSERHRLLLVAEGAHDVDDFVAAYLQEQPLERRNYYQNHCLFVRSVESWHRLCDHKRRHILVASPQLGLDSDNQTLQTAATRQNHAIVVPVGGRQGRGDGTILRLRSPSQHAIDRILEQHNFPPTLRRKLAQVAGGHLAALRRHLLDLGSHPAYATWETARSLGLAGLAGRWNGGNLADRSALETIVNRSYDSWISEIRGAAVRSDAPIVQHNEHWRFVTRSEAWNALGVVLSDDDLDRFRTVAVSVLMDDDPKYFLHRRDRLAGAVRGEVARYSDHLKAGIAETVALLGSRPGALSSCSQQMAGNHAHAIVRDVLSNAPWTRWASLGPHLAMLAEGAPERFLDAIEQGLEQPNESAFNHILSEDSGSVGPFDISETSGLLWALEVLAWSPKYLARAALNLATLASIDPGSSWANSPSNTLRAIFLPWLPQTAGDHTNKLGALKGILREHSEVGWQLLLALLPERRGFSMGSQQPTWRSWIPDTWTGRVTHAERWKAVSSYFDLALSTAKHKPGRLRDLIEKLPELPFQLHPKLLTRLESDEIRKLPERQRFIVREALEGVLRLHRRYRETDWALSEVALARIADTVSAISIESPILKSKWLFQKHTGDAYDGHGSFEEQRRRLEEARQEVLRGILDSAGTAGAYELASEASAPGDVGYSLAQVVSEDEEQELLVRFRTGLDDAERAMLASYCWAQFWRRGADWIDETVSCDWKKEEKAEFLGFLPFVADVWDRVGRILGHTDEKLYWTNIRFNPYPVKDDLSEPVRKFLRHGRIDGAVVCIASTVRDDRFDPQTALQVLEVLLEHDAAQDAVDWGEVIEIIVRLQQMPGVDEAQLFGIEWGYLQILRVGSRGEPVTVMKRLATDPELFALVIGLAFSRNESGSEGDKNVQEEEKPRATNAYMLLHSWNVCPGRDSMGNVDSALLRAWITRARDMADENDNREIAELYIGRCIAHCLGELEDAWVPDGVADVLDAKEYKDVRGGLVLGILARRGVFTVTGGREEAKLAQVFDERAEELESRGYVRLAGAVREVADNYRAQSERFAAEEEDRER